MPVELSLETLLDAINAVKGEVAGLASSLRSAEERIARLETAAYTPPESPSFPTETLSEIELIPHPASSKRAIPTIDTQQNDEIQPRDQQLPVKSCSGDLPCEIQHHLLPISDGIAALTSHILRIERAIGRSESSHSSGTLETGFHSPQLDKDTASSQQGQEETQELPRPKKRHDRRSFIAKGLDSSAATPRPVFGEISTPRRRVVSLNIVDSPFGDYVDEKSPFSQLARPLAGASGGFSGRLSQLRDDPTLPTVPSPSSPFAHSKTYGVFGGKSSLLQDDAQLSVEALPPSLFPGKFSFALKTKPSQQLDDRQSTFGLPFALKAESS
jgi:hypothetical protein